MSEGREVGGETRALRRGMAAALAAGLLLRVFFVWRYAYVSEDSLLYGDIARNLLSHHVYGLSETIDGVAGVRPTLIRLPGYPLFLVACFAVFGVAKYGAVIAVQVAMDIWTCLLLAGVARRVFGERAGLAALWLGVLCPFMANYTAAPLTETPTLFCMALAFYALVRWRESGSGLNRWVGVVGFALAWAVLLRPEQGLLAVALAPAMFWMAVRTGNRALAPGTSCGSRKVRHFVRFWTLRVLPVLLVCALTVLPLAPWALRNWRTFHVLQPLAPRYANDPGESNPYGFQRWYRTWAIDFASTDQVYWNYESAPISIGDLPNRAFDSNEQYAATEAAMAEYNETTSSTPELDAKFAAIAKERVAADPLRYYVALPLARVLNMMLRPRLDILPISVQWWKWGREWWETLFAWAYGLLNLGYLVVAGYALKARKDWGEYAPLMWGMVATVVLRALLLLNMDNSEPRYTLEFYPVLIVLGGSVIGRRLARESTAEVAA